MLDITAEYATALTEKHIDHTYEVEYGRKFDKIIQRYKQYESRSVHAFIERETGKLIKASGWNAPQRDKDGLAYRYDLSTPEGFDKALNDSDPYGSYLYKR